MTWFGKEPYGDWVQKLLSSYRAKQMAMFEIDAATARGERQSIMLTSEHDSRIGRHDLRPHALITLPDVSGEPLWLLNDVKLDGMSVFGQMGDIPADLFATSAIDGFVRWRALGKSVTVDVTYDGRQAPAKFQACLVCSTPWSLQ